MKEKRRPVLVLIKMVLSLVASILFEAISLLLLIVTTAVLFDDRGLINWGAWIVFVILGLACVVASVTLFVCFSNLLRRA